VEEAQGGVPGFGNNAFERRFAPGNIESGQSMLPVESE
jgi:hypothetical protein